MNKMTKIFTILACSIFVTGCGQTAQSQETKDYASEKATAVDETGSSVIQEEKVIWETEPFFIDGNRYLVHSTLFEDIEEAGWHLGNNLDFNPLEITVPSNSYRGATVRFFFYIGDSNDKYATLGVGVMNDTEYEKKTSECDIYEFSLNSGPEIVSFELPGGLHNGSTIEDIISVYGEPEQKEEDELYHEIQMVYLGAPSYVDGMFRYSSNMLTLYLENKSGSEYKLVGFDIVIV